jgi:hypothetical protein
MATELTTERDKPMSEADDLRDQAQTEYDKIRNITDLTPEARLRAIAKAYLNVRGQLSDLGNATQRAVVGNQEALERKLFGIPDANNPSAMISYRDAQDRAARLDLESDAIAMLTRASVSGDDLLVRALLEAGYTNAWTNLINTYTAAHPAMEAAAEQLWDIITRKQAPAIVTNFTYYAPTPPELAGFSDFKIQEIADNAPVSSQAFATALGSGQ